MKKTTMHLKNFIGTDYEVGCAVGRWMLTRPEQLHMAILPPGAYPADKLQAIRQLLDQHCGGLNDEIQGFADTLKISPDQVLFYAMTYLEKGCSLMAINAERSATGHNLMARSYDFTDGMEDMCFAYTAIEGKYRHISSTVNLFGRCDGMNEHGLAVGMASNGLPIGNFEGGQPAGAAGFNFWIVIRGILEHCKTVAEAIDWVLRAPIGFNINLMLADRQDRIALLQCVDGHKAYRTVESGETNGSNGFLHATNHVILEELKSYEKTLMENSIRRAELIVNRFDGCDKIGKEDFKQLLSTSYPDGLCCHYYNQFFGTLRSMVFDPTAMTIEAAFGSPQVNTWKTFRVEPLAEHDTEVLLPQEQADPTFFNIIS